jgi:dienelactone hydrolase
MAAFLTYDRHTVENYVGQYTYGGKNSVSIIDARSTPLGRLLLHDSRTGLLRDLKPFNHYIHTYGPALGQDEPVEGSVTFLSKDGDIHRFIWMHGNSTPAEFPAKNRLDESTVPFPDNGRTLAGTLVRPLEGDPFPAVVLLGDPAGMPRSLLESCARQLALTGLAVLALAGGDADGWTGDSTASLARVAAEALAYLRRQAWAVPGRVGLAGINGGVAVLARTAALDTGKGPDFVAVFLESGEAGPVRTGLTDALVRGIAAPSLWVLAGPEPRATWRGEMERLERCGSPLGTNVLTVPLEAEAGATGWAGKALLVDRAGSVFARLAGPWIQQGR